MADAAGHPVDSAATSNKRLPVASSRTGRSAEFWKEVRAQTECDLATKTLGAYLQRCHRAHRVQYSSICAQSGSGCLPPPCASGCPAWETLCNATDATCTRKDFRRAGRDVETALQLPRAPFLPNRRHELLDKLCKVPLKASPTRKPLQTAYPHLRLVCRKHCLPRAVCGKLRHQKMHCQGRAHDKMRHSTEATI